MPSCLPVRAISAFQPAKISSSSAPARLLANTTNARPARTINGRSQASKTSTWVQMMAKSRKIISKKRGRPATGRNPVFAIRLPVELTAAIEKWAARNETASWSDKIRRLVELGLSGSQPMKRRSPKDALKALNMAAQQIDKLVDASAPPEEQAKRKRRLLKGPGEFQELRADLLKKKA